MKPQQLAACFYQTAHPTKTTTTHGPHSAVCSVQCGQQMAVLVQVDDDVGEMHKGGQGLYEYVHV